MGREGGEEWTTAKEVVGDGSWGGRSEHIAMGSSRDGGCISNQVGNTLELS